MRKLKFALVFNLILICNICVSQDIKLQKSLIFDDTHKHELMQYNGLHGLYKKYISSQDGSNCQFYPSCSHFAKLALKKFPLPIALFLSADRLLRCNGRVEDYPLNAANKAVDLP